MDIARKIDVESIREDLKDWQKIVRKYSKPDTRLALIQLFNTFGPFVAIWIMMYVTMDYNTWLTLALAVANGFLMARIFIIQHDCGHLSFLKNKKINHAIGLACSFFSTIPYTYWSKVHSYHHGHNGQLEVRDIGDIPTLTVDEYRAKGKLARLWYRFYRSPLMMFCIIPTVYLGLVLRLPTIGFKGWEKTHKKLYFHSFLLVSIYGLLVFFLGWKFLWVQLLIVFVFGMIAFFFFYVQHQHEEGYKQWKDNWDYLVSAVVGSTYFKLPRLFQWLTGNIGFHHIHHLSPRIPNYKLEKCAKENPILQKHAITITLKDTIKCMKHKLWDEQSQRMITFKEFYQKYWKKGEKPVVDTEKKEGTYYTKWF